MTQDNQPSQNSVPPALPAEPPLPPAMPPQGYTRQYPYPLPPSSSKNIARILGIVALAIVVVGGGCLVSIILPGINAATDRNNRIKCASNLRRIGQAMTLYFNDTRCYPRTYYNPSQGVAFTPDFTGGAKNNPASMPFLPEPEGSVGTNNVLAAMFLLIRTTDLSPDAFVCPSSRQETDTFASGEKLTRNDVSNFSSAANISYSFANPYPTKEAMKAWYKWSPNVTADFVIAADRNDGFTTGNASDVESLTSNAAQDEQRQANSRNHGGDGQNVLFNDGHVEFAQTMWVGAGKDGIYTAARTGGSTTPGISQQLSPAASKDTTTTDPQLDLDTILIPKF